jgi:hypothetical protein
MFRLVADTHLSDIGGLYWQKQQQCAPCSILKMSVNEASIVYVAAYLAIQALHGSLHS